MGVVIGFITCQDCSTDSLACSSSPVSVSESIMYNVPNLFILFLSEGKWNQPTYKVHAADEFMLLGTLYIITVW